MEVIPMWTSDIRLIRLGCLLIIAGLHQHFHSLIKVTIVKTCLSIDTCIMSYVAHLTRINTLFYLLSTRMARRRNQARPPVQPAAPPAIVLAPHDIDGLSISDMYRNPMAFQIMLNTIGVPDRERARITNDGFTHMHELVAHYANDVTGFKKYLENLNKTFATADVTLKVYFTPPVTSKLIGVMHYFNVAVNGYHKIPDINTITAIESSGFGRCYQDFIKKKDLDDDDDDLDIPKLLGSTNWVDFRDAFTSKLSLHAGSRGFPIDYVIDSTPRHATHGNALQSEVESIDLDDNDEYLHLVTHFGQPFKADNAQVWNKLRCETSWWLEGVLQNRFWW